MVNENKKYLVILGRQDKISVAELEAVYGEDRVRVVGEKVAIVEAKNVDIDRLGGVMKVGEIISGKTGEYLAGLEGEGKITLGVSDYSRGATRQGVMREALSLKSLMKKRGRSVRVVPNTEATLSTATSHHNQLGEKKNHIEFIRFKEVVAVSIGTQNITAYARRDQARPARDATNGMLPPKLAQILINLGGGLPEGKTILDPFCGTGVVLQEAMLMGYSVYGTDLNPKMIEYSKRNLEWLFKGKIDERVKLEAGDATSHKWRTPIDAVASEVYLGPPMSKPPVEIKFRTVREECRRVVVGFLKNLAGQVESGVSVVLAVPAWRRDNGEFSGLNILDEAGKLGYNVRKFKNVPQSELLYYRENQIVARELIVLTRK